MTVTQILDEARNNLNAASDTLWSDTELYLKLYQVMLRVARKTRCIEDAESQNTVASQADYTAPTAACEIWRVTYEGKKLQLIDKREYDSANPNAVTSSGTPAFYLVYDATITLHPIPSAVGALKVWCYKIPSAVPTSATTLEIPAAYHDVLVSGLTFLMCPKDLGHPLTAFFRDQYNAGLAEMESHFRSKRRGDRFAVVKTEEGNLTTDFGII